MANIESLIEQLDECRAEIKEWERKKKACEDNLCELWLTQRQLKAKIEHLAHLY